MVPLYPLPERRRCPRGHRLDVAGVSRHYAHLLGLSTRSCTVCHESDPHTAAWCELDPTRQVGADQASGSGLELVAFPPAARGGTGTIALQLDGQALGEIQVALCGPCRTGVIARVASERTRMGIGRVLVAAALARGPRFRWSTDPIPIPDAGAVRGFWAAAAPEQLRLGDPLRCTDMAPR